MSLAGTALQAYLCCLLLWRQYYRQFGFFSLCMAISVTDTIASLAVRNHPSLYFDMYWANEALSVVLIFFALQEAFYLVFRNFLSIPGFRFLFPGIGILMVAVAVFRAFVQPAPDTNALTSTLISLEIAVGFLQFGIFCLFVLLVRFFHSRWRQRAFGVVLGFGIAAAGSLVVYLLRSEFGTKFNPVVRVTPAIAYIMAVVVWLITFLRVEPEPPMQSWASVLTPEQMVSELRRYTQTVKGILKR